MSEWAITTAGLGKRFRKKWAVKGLDLRVPRGSVFGFLGPNGAGKSTTINMLMGLVPMTEGSISVLGMDPRKEDVAIKRRVGYVAEYHGFYETMRVDETIAIVSAYHKTWNNDLCASLMEQFSLDGAQKIKELSKGMRAKLALLLALAFEPEMLVLDEPTGGLDPAARRSFVESILGLFQETGRTVFVSSHLLNEFAGLLDHVAFMKGGTLQLSCPLDELHRRMKRARLIFPDGVPKGLSIPGSMSIRANGREAVVSIRDYDADTTSAALRRTGAASFEIAEMSLEDIFVDLVGN